MPLQTIITDQQSEVTALIKENAVLRESKAHLEEQIELLKRQIFVKRFEKLIKNLNESQLYFDGFEGAENATPVKKQPVPAHERTKPRRD